MSRPKPSRLRPAAPAALLVALAAALATGAFIASAASAHGDDGTLELVSNAPSGTSSVITVKLSYENDAEPVASATVTVAGDNGAGVGLDPVPMAAGSTPGEFTATVQFPSAGTWNLRVTSVTPSATLSLTQDVAADPGVTASTATTVAGAGAGAGATTTEATDDGATVTSGTATDASSDDGGSSPILWIVGGLVVLGCIAIGVVFVRQGRTPGPID